jgi:hypothetical protein
MENQDKKTSRASQTREKESRPKVWSPPSLLDAPPAPAGFVHRWLRAESMGFDDSANVQGRLRSGFELVRADEYNEAFDNDLMREEHPSMPISVDRNTRVTFGGTKK